MTNRDRLTYFGDVRVPYDELGCPSGYNGYIASWNRGKLSKLSKGFLPIGIHNYDYSYNALGQRVGISYTYTPPKSSSSSAVSIGTLLGYNKSYAYDQSGRLICESKKSQYYGDLDDSEKIVFLYDEAGMVGFVYTKSGDSNTYYYDRNIRGDVISIYDTNGNLKVKYNYDAWGNCTVSSETNDYVLARVNPIRYRGYYYDQDTGLYYLNARYYNPEWRRFISPDDTAYLDPDTPNGLNLYAYCNNDPINYADPSGHDPEWWQWALSGLSLAAGVACCIFVPGGQVFGVGLIVNGASGLIANTMDLMGVDGKTASIISAGLSIVSGIALCCIPIGGIAAFAGIGAGLIGQGVGSIAGGYISEALGGSFELGSTLGGIAGSIAGGFAYRGIMSYKFSHMTAYQKGAYAEKYVKAIYGNKVFKLTTGANRPDLLFNNGSTLIEVKNVASQSLTNQLNRYLNLGYGTNIIYVRVGTRVSSALKASSYVIKYLPW